jgi:hypothetical protein
LGFFTVPATRSFSSALNACDNPAKI